MDATQNSGGTSTAPTPGDAIRLAVVGHVDHGKSTLIGRLLHDTGSLPAGAMDKARAAAGGNPDLAFAFLTDHFAEERDQARTIDTTHVFFRHAGRHYVLIDNPGHAEFLPNLFGGASRADAALLVIDAARGVEYQAVAHGHLLGLLGVRQAIPVLNKMDAVAWSAATFADRAARAARLLAAAGLHALPAVPVCALQGENLARPSARMPWHRGPTLLTAIQNVSAPPAPRDRPMRFAVQGLLPSDKGEVYLGRVEDGTLRAGEKVRVMPENSENRVLSIETFGGSRPTAEAGESVAVTLAHPLPRPRGTTLSDAANPPLASRTLGGRLFWMDTRPLTRGEFVRLSIATQDLAARVEALSDCFAAAAPEAVVREADRLAYGEIARITLSVTEHTAVYEPGSHGNALGRFALTRGGNVAGAGTVSDQACTMPE